MSLLAAIITLSAQSPKELCSQTTDSNSNSATYYLYDRDSESVSFLSNGDDKNNWLYSFLLKINEITDQVPCT